MLRRCHNKSSAVDFKAGKLQPKYEGPFIIDSPQGVNMFTLKDLRGKKVGTAHVKDLKPYSE